MFIWKIFIYALAASGILVSAAKKVLKVRKLSVLHEWKELEFAFPSTVEREFAVKNGFYVKGNGIPVDFDIEYGENSSLYRTFVTVPRLGLGIPYTLATFVNGGEGKSPVLNAYPNYYMHASHGSDCTGITSAIRIFIDECWRLWVVDSGQIASVQFCPPQIIVFDLVTDRIVQRHTIPDSIYNPGVSVFTAAIADVRDPSPGQCLDTKLYIADPWGFGLIVYDSLKQVSWRIEHDLMRPANRLLRDNYVSDGIFTLSLSPKTDEERKMYFHALNSKKEIVVPLRIIEDQSRWQNDTGSGSNEFKILGNRRIQCETEAMDSAGNLYCSLLRLNSVITWNSKTRYNSDNLKIYAHNPDQLRFITSLKVVRNSRGEEELWALSNDPKLFYEGKPGDAEIKFQLVGCRIRDYLSGKPCTVDAA